MICDFVCNMCGKQFKSQKTLTQHNRDVHIEEDIPCSLCDKTFRMKKHLAYHKFSKHTEKESLQCDIDCIYMTSLHCVFTLSVFGCVEPLKKISGWVFLLNGLGLFSTTLWACCRFWRRGRELPLNWEAPMVSTIISSFSAQGARFSTLGSRRWMGMWRRSSATATTPWLPRCWRRTPSSSKERRLLLTKSWTSETLSWRMAVFASCLFPSPRMSPAS